MMLFLSTPTLYFYEDGLLRFNLKVAAFILRFSLLRPLQQEEMRRFQLSCAEKQEASISPPLRIMAGVFGLLLFTHAFSQKV